MLFHNLPVTVIQAADPRHPYPHVYWNLWERRLFPYNDLTIGDPVCLAQTDSASSLLTWLVKVTNVVTLRYRSLSDAADILEHKFGVRRVEFLRDPYTAGKPAEGVLLAWSAQPLSVLNMARPPQVRFQRQGWAKLDDFLAHRLLSLPPGLSGQSRHVDMKGTEWALRERARAR